MRCRLGAPLHYDDRRHGYSYRDPSYRLPTWSITEGELVALFLAGRVLRQWRGTPYGPALERAFARIEAGLGGVVTIDLAGLASAFSVTTTAEAPFEPATFATLASAVLHRRRLVLDYDSATGGRSHREVDPYHLAQVDGQWYLVAHCHARDEVRMFAPGRVRGLEETGASFSRPDDFRIEDYLAGSMAVLRGDEGEAYRVRLRFAGAAARYVAERTWHSSQAIEEQPDGSLVLGLELSHLREVERWALSWGSECEVLEPEELRDRVRAELEHSASHYRSPPVRRPSRRPRP
jgi:proteasome accessory factor B